MAKSNKIINHFTLDMTDQITFDIRIIRWSLDYNSLNDDYKLETPILLQDKNGPCPLIALVNTLLLKYELNQRNYDDFTEPDLLSQSKNSSLVELKILLAGHEAATGSIKLDVLLSQIGEMVLIFKKDKPMNYEVDNLLALLPLLHTGLSVNPNLMNGNFDETNLSTDLFRLFDLKFKHGWCINQIDSEDVVWETTGANIGDDDNYSKLIELFNQLQTFDAIQDYLLLGESTNISKIDLLKNQLLIKKWLSLNSTQLTKIGLTRLNLDLRDEEFIIFFRNNHFNTLYKKNNNDLYLLITDSVINDKSNKITWQSLNSVTGKDDLFFNGDFLPVFDLDFGIDEDYLLTKQLQEEEDQRMAREIEEQQKKRSFVKRLKTLLKRTTGTERATGEEKEKKEKKEKLGCVIA